ncbi:MAG: helix-turn-helix domain-containing protein [Clostridioides difficile]
MGILKLEYDLGYTHIVQAINKNMKRIGAYSPIEIDIDEYKDKKDIYYTPNTFNSPIKRQRNYLWQLHRFYIDIDHKKGTRAIESFEVVGAIEQLVENKKIPEPTEYINSGRGIHVYWDIANCHIMLLDLWEKIENYLFNQVKEIEKDIKNIEVDKRATDPTRLLRLPGTINSKDNSKCYSMLKREDNIYNIFDLKKAYIKPNKAYKKNKSTIAYLPTKNLYTLNKSRLEDFKAIVSLRNGEVKGYRNTLIMFYSYHYRLINEITVEELINITKEFNKSFREPYKIRELISVCRSVNRTVKHFQEDESKGYKFTNKYIIDALDISELEQRKLLTIISTDEKYRRKNIKRNAARRNEEGLTSRQQQKRDLITKVKELKQQGLKQVEIAEKLGITKGTVSKYLKL